MRNFNDNPYRSLIYGVNTLVQFPNGKPHIEINFDNAATTPPFKSVIESILNFSPYYSSIHRGEGYKSRLSTDLYEKSRFIVKDFINDFDDKYDVIYVKNCTEAINKLAGIWASAFSGSIILSTFMEHHSNDLPWRKNFDVKYISLDKNGCLDINDLKNKLELYKGKISLVAVSGASNVTGVINPIHYIASLVHSYDAKLLVDGAQLIPHSKFSMGLENSNDFIDFLAFSSHKMYSPFGCGVLVGPKNIFNSFPPDHVGGGTIDFVSHDKVTWASSPDRNEAGSPNVIGSIALASSIKTLSKIGMKNIEDFERALTVYATQGMLSMDCINLYGNYNDFENKVSIISFNIKGIHHSIVAKALALDFGIAVRSGCFCAYPYVQSLLKIPEKIIDEMSYLKKDLRPGMVRVSFGLYNTFKEVDVLLYALSTIIQNKDYYISKYS